MKKSPVAVELGKMARGIPKKFSPAEIKKRRARMAKVRKLRWLDKYILR